MNDSAVLINVLFWTILFLGLNTSGWLMLIPGASIVALPFIVYIIGKDKGWHRGVREERYRNYIAYAQLARRRAVE